MAGEGFDRRSFIKACAGVAGAGAAAAAGFGMFRPVSDVGVEIIPISYPGVKVLEGSPAPYGMPLIPLELTSDGALRGVPDVTDDQLMWYKYCSHERAPGTFQDFESDNLISYYVTEEKIEKGLDAWYKGQIGDTIRVEDFPDEEPSDDFQQFPGVGAPFEWRSAGVPSESKITGIVIKVPRDELEFNGPIPAPEEAFIVEHPDDPEIVFIATCSFCTHFCCVAGFHEAQLALSSGHGSRIFCTCHLSRYDPFTIETYNRTVFSFPDAEAEHSGGGGDGGSGGGGH